MEYKFKFEKIEAFQVTEDVIFPQWFNEQFKEEKARINEDGSLDVQEFKHTIKANIGDYIVKENEDISVWDKESFEYFFEDVEKVRLIKVS